MLKFTTTVFDREKIKASLSFETRYPLFNHTSHTMCVSHILKKFHKGILIAVTISVAARYHKL